MITKNLLGRKKGAANLVGVFIGISIVVLMAFAVALPIIQQGIAQANLTGPAAALAGLIPLLFVVAIVLLIVGLYKFR